MTKNTSSNRAVVPEAKGALDRFKFEVANELGVPLTDGYNGNLTSKQNGSVGGYKVNPIFTERSTTFYRALRSFPGHKEPVKYTYFFAF